MGKREKMAQRAKRIKQKKANSRAKIIRKKPKKKNKSTQIWKRRRPKGNQRIKSQNNSST